MDLAESIRKTAKKKKLTLEAFRKQAGLANGTFYNLLAGKPPRMLRTLEKLRDAGVRLPRDVVPGSAKGIASTAA